MAISKINAASIADGTVVASDIANGTITATQIADSTITLGKLSATGTKSSSTFLRGDNSFVAVTTDLVGDTTPQLGEAAPIQVALNNMVLSSTSVKEYNVDMASAIIAGIPTLIVYVLAGKYFIRGLTSGAVKG